MGVSFSQARVPAATPFLRDPRTLRAIAAAEGLYAYGGANPRSGAAFWAWVATVGSYQTSDPSTATRTIVNVASGRGRLFGVIGPNINNGGNTTFTITVDGVAYTCGPYSSTNVGQILLGDITVPLSLYTTANDAGGVLSAGAARTTNNIVADMADQLTLRSPVEVPTFLKFDVSLKVEVACNVVRNPGTNGANAGAIWALDG